MVEGPFGPACLIERLRAATVAAMYRDKCGADVDFAALGVDELELYLCKATGMRFWRPECIAGDEEFYRQLSRKFPRYYQDWRWEWGLALKQLRGSDRLLEVGSGRGNFLRWTEGKVRQAEGLEFNRAALAESTTRWPVRSITLADLAEREPEFFDVVCGFQVLEHMVRPAEFLHDCLACLRPGGRLILSTPDPENEGLRRRGDAFDLPPHHMGQFPLASYRRIAALLGLRLARIDRSPFNPFGARPPGEPRTERLRSTIRREAGNLIARLVRKRGPTLMVTLVK